ncbi:MAG: DUF4340 domain-containing protein [Deltaproteobacteria bacterium]|nr:DUF4340 domain-containing protein [Deltaproteobacteria bacterium]
MAKNIIAVCVLAVLGGVAYFVFNKAPAQGTKAALDVLKPVSVDRLDRIEILRHEGSGSTLREEIIVLEKAGGVWRMLKPVEYPANQATVKVMVDVLSKLKVMDIISERTEKHRVLEVDDELGIVVTASAGDEVLSRFIIGATRLTITFIRLPGSNAVYRTAGTYRSTFNQPSKSLRDRTVMKLNPDSVREVRYFNEGGELTIVKTEPSEELAFEPKGIDIPNFNTHRATQNVRAISNLNARDFVDEPLDADITGLTETAPRVEIDTVKEQNLVVWIGKEQKDTRQTYVKTSLSDEVSLISSHFVSSMKAKASDFARTDEQMAKEKEMQKEAAAHLAEHEKARSTRKAAEETEHH